MDQFSRKPTWPGYTPNFAGKTASQRLSTSLRTGSQHRTITATTSVPLEGRPLQQ